MPRVTQYYYEQLNKDQKKVYLAIKEGLEQMKTSFPVLRCDSKELCDIYFMVRLDHPRLFYSVSFRYRYYEDSTYLELIPDYLFKKDKLKEHEAAMEARITRLAKQAEKLDEKGKEKFIHDFICTQVRYDKLEKEYSHEIIGALGNGVAVCEGIAKAVKALCDQLNIWCIIALAENNPEKKIKYRHAWNLVRINGKYYHLDATFDNAMSSDGVLRYDYFNLSDGQIFRDHEPLVWPVPVCEDKHNFYYQDNKLSWTTLDEVRNRTVQAVKKNKILVFHWRGGYLTRQVLSELMSIFAEEAEKKKKKAMVSVNWSQAVVKVRFEDHEESGAQEQDETLEGYGTITESGFLGADDPSADTTGEKADEQ